MKQIKLKQIGSFTKTHGIHGHLALSLSDNISYDLLDKGLIEKEAVFVEIDGIPVPFFIAKNGIRELNDKTILLSLDEIDNEKSKKLYPAKVYINTYHISELEEIDKSSPGNWLGFSVIDQNIGPIGSLVEFIEIKENPLLNINWNGKEILIPLMADFIIEIDIENEQITTNLPDGYIDALG